MAQMEAGAPDNSLQEFLERLSAHNEQVVMVSPKIRVPECVTIENGDIVSLSPELAEQLNLKPGQILRMEAKHQL